MSSVGTPWSVLNVEGNEDISDDELDNAQEDESPEASSILSPASKRAKKRQAAARNKRAKQEAKQQAEQQQQQSSSTSNNKSVPGLHIKSPAPNGKLKAASSAASSATSSDLQQSTAKTNGASSGKGLPAPPTFVNDSASINGRLAVNPSAVPAASKLGDPFLQQTGAAASSSSSQASTSGASSSLLSATRPSLPTLVSSTSTTTTTNANSYAASAATETEGEEEDTSLLLDGDDESTSSASEAEDGDEDISREEQGNLAEPPTPRPAPPKVFVNTATDAANAIKSGTSSALNAVAQSSITPTSLQNLAATAKDSELLKSDDTVDAAAAAAQAYGSDHDPSKKWKSVITRTIWTLVMIVGFAALMTMGHVYLIMLVMFCQAAVFKEISALFDVAAKPIHTHHHHHHGKNGDKQISPTRAARDARARAERERWSKVTSWYFFAATNYFLHGETIIYYFKHIVFVDAYFIPFARHHRFISFMLYVLGFVGFVTNLKRNQLRRQFGLFCWIHMSLLLIVVSSHFIVNNILEGIIWFWLPASLVVMNDIAAYVWGMLFGRTQLIKLSPKKTVEGFVGAAFTTIVFAYIWATIFMRYSYMICPATDLGTTAFSSVACEPNDTFNWRYFVLPSEISQVLSMVYPVEQIPWAPFQFHAIIMGIFASLVAPFGGFFASGFKRAFNVKDFGDSIPGHGGMTDRMDCQFLMGLFAYVYYSSIIRDNHVTVGAVMQTIVSSLNQQEQAELAKALAGYLAQQGIQWK